MSDNLTETVIKTTPHGSFKNSLEYAIKPPRNPLFLFPGDTVKYKGRSHWVVSVQALRESVRTRHQIYSLYSEHFHKYCLLDIEKPTGTVSWVPRHELVFVERENWVPTYLLYRQVYAALIVQSSEYTRIGDEKEIKHISKDYVIGNGVPVFGIESDEIDPAYPRIYVWHGRTKHWKYLKNQVDFRIVPGSQTYDIEVDGYLDGDHIMPKVIELKHNLTIPDDWDIYLRGVGSINV